VFDPGTIDVPPPCDVGDGATVPTCVCRFCCASACRSCSARWARRLTIPLLALALLRFPLSALPFLVHVLDDRTVRERTRRCERRYDRVQESPDLRLGCTGQTRRQRRDRLGVAAPTPASTRVLAEGRMAVAEAAKLHAVSRCDTIEAD
jgi:hypothetical protein